MICKNCNKEVDIDSKFCTYCGSNLNNINVKTKIINENKTSIKDFYLTYHGSIGRKEFFFRAFLPFTTLLIILITIFQIVRLFSVMDKLPKELILLSYIIIGILWLILQILIIVTVIKRFHDCKINAWLSVLIFIPIINVFTTIGLFLMPTRISCKYENKRNDYKFNKIRWSLLVIKIVLIIGALFIFSFAKAFEEIELTKKQKDIEKYQKDYLGNYKASIDNIVVNVYDDSWNPTLMKISIQVKSQFSKVVVFIPEHKAEILDKIISLMNTKKSTELLLKSGQDLLKMEIIDFIHSISKDITISELVFTEYIISK